MKRMPQVYPINMEKFDCFFESLKVARQRLAWYSFDIATGALSTWISSDAFWDCSFNGVGFGAMNSNLLKHEPCWWYSGICTSLSLQLTDWFGSLDQDWVSIRRGCLNQPIKTNRKCELCRGQSWPFINIFIPSIAMFENISLTLQYQIFNLTSKSAVKLGREISIFLVDSTAILTASKPTHHFFNQQTRFWQIFLQLKCRKAILTLRF